MATPVKNGYLITATATETEYELDGYVGGGAPVNLFCVGTGGFRATVAPRGSANVITGNTNFANITVANTWIIFNMDSKSTLRVLGGTGTFIISW